MSTLREVSSPKSFYSKSLFGFTDFVIRCNTTPVIEFIAGISNKFVPFFSSFSKAESSLSNCSIKQTKSTQMINLMIDFGSNGENLKRAVRSKIKRLFAKLVSIPDSRADLVADFNSRCFFGWQIGENWTKWCFSGPTPGWNRLWFGRILNWNKLSKFSILELLIRWRSIFAFRKQCSIWTPFSNQNFWFKRGVRGKETPSGLTFERQ